MAGRVPPYNEEAEVATLGALLLDAEAIGTVVEILRPEDFYTQAHQHVYRTILELWDRDQRADLITLTDALNHAGVLERVGGAAYVSSLTTAVPTSANVAYYAEIVQQASLRRRLIQIAAEITENCYDDTIATPRLLDQAEQQIFAITESRRTQGYVSAGEVVKRTVDTIEELYKSEAEYTGVPSGFQRLDQLTSGFQKSEFIVIGARPSIGKTALALTMAANMAIRSRVPVGFFTLEMSDLQLMQRLVAGEGRIASGAIRTGMLKQADFINLTNAAGRIYEAPLWIADTPGMRLLDLRAQARRMVSQHGVRVIFVDYLTLLNSDNSEIARHEQVAEISRSLKALARELDLPIIALSQVTRETEGKVPMLSHIRESGSIEQDADMVLFLHRDRGTEHESGEIPDVIETQLIIAKHRNGPVGTVKLAFVPRFTKYENYSDDI